MKTFPIILNKDEFISKISHLDEIGINERDGYTVIQYNVAFPETFITSEARECRGIVFDNTTGKVLRRPFQKFFNVNEKEETQMDNLKDEQVLYVSEKLDGTLIAPFVLNNNIIWGTKRVAADFDKAVKQYLNTLDKQTKENYEKLVNFFNGIGVSTLFEYHDETCPGSVVVIKYGTPFLRIIGLRANTDGHYIDLDLLRPMIECCYPGVEIVDRRPTKSLQDIKDELETLEGEEGRVVMLEDTGFVKMKTPWYSKRHSIKSLFSFDHIKAQLVLEIHELSLDDISPNMLDEDREEYARFAKELNILIHKVKDHIVDIASNYSNRKEYGLAKKEGTIFDNLVFGVIADKSTAYQSVVNHLKKYTSKAIKFSKWQAEAENY